MRRRYTIAAAIMAFFLLVAADFPTQQSSVENPARVSADGVLDAGESLADLQVDYTLPNGTTGQATLGAVGTRTVPAGKDARVRVRIMIEFGPDGAFDPPTP